MKTFSRSSRQPSDWGKRSTSNVSRPVQAELGEDRYKALLAQVNAFFSTSERDMVAEKAAAIIEIKKLMIEYQLTTEDLLD
jgi:endonuclease YncB( thermonuclease family)